MPKFLNIFSRRERSVGDVMTLQDWDGNRFLGKVVSDLGADRSHLNEIPDTRNPGKTKIVDNWRRWYRVEVPDECLHSDERNRWS